jgi:hypothetical protein
MNPNVIPIDPEAVYRVAMIFAMATQTMIWFALWSQRMNKTLDARFPELITAGGILATGLATTAATSASLPLVPIAMDEIPYREPVLSLIVVFWTVCLIPYALQILARVFRLADTSKP